MVTTGLISLSIQVVLQKEIAFNDKPFLSIMSTIKQSSLSKSALALSLTFRLMFGCCNRSLTTSKVLFICSKIGKKSEGNHMITKDCPHFFCPFYCNERWKVL